MSVDHSTPIADGGARGIADMLLVVGDGAIQVRELPVGELVIGRGSQCDLVIDHAVFSRRHAVVRRSAQLTVQDLGSVNGTRVGAAELRGGEPVALRLGDSFHIGPFTFVAISRARGELRSVSGRDTLVVADPTPEGAPSIVREVAASGVSVLVLGETGVGKEVLADTIHGFSRRPGALVRVNCAALAESLFESELFGYEKGAFTGAAAAKVGLLESADRGTLFLDEVGELPPAIQAKLLRVVEMGEVTRVGAVRPVRIDVRFVAATNRDLAAEVEAGRFRRDLFFRLDGVSFAIPPLRERRDAIGRLAAGFVAGRARIGAEVLARLEAHDWPGNVRELRAVIERAVLFARGGDLEVQHLTFGKPAAAAPERQVAPPGGEPWTAEEREDRERVIRALEQSAGNQTRAAAALGISRSTLINKLRAYRIKRPRR
jgi:transcriptional regulator with GAF, ATPase, and Fis domain